MNRSILMTGINPKYMIYEDGRIYSLISNKFLNPRKAGNGKGLNVDIRCTEVQGRLRNTRRAFMINHLVYHYFIEKLDLFADDYIIDHKNGNRQDFSPSNLKKISRAKFTAQEIKKGNRVMITDLGLKPISSSKLTKKQSEEVYRLVNAGATKVSLAGKYGVSEMSILRAYRRVEKELRDLPVKTFYQWLNDLK